MYQSLSVKCACGAVTANLTGPFRDAIACHCETCRRQSGHYAAATRIDAEGLHLLTFERLKWWSASETAQRGFCA
ncbi:MAG: GFA family protein, partial [Hyphomicrobiales bacterium]